jgi:hypothetical protein
MGTDTNLHDIREKISQLKTAIMYSMSDELTQLPNSIVTALQVDDERQLWFTCPRPLLGMYEEGQCFPARLHFYRKGYFFHIEVSGKATIMNTSLYEELPISQSHTGDVMLIKMAMSSVEYTAPYEKKKKTRLETMVEQGFNWMVKHIALPHPTRSLLPKNIG